MSPFTKVKMSPYMEAESGQTTHDERKRDQKDRNDEPVGRKTNNPTTGSRTPGDQCQAGKAVVEQVSKTRSRRADK